jgi:myo-inositol-1(or 4)-monophosphatase
MALKRKETSYLKVAMEAARQGGRILMASYGKLKTSQISMKAKNDFVTEIDKRSEKAVISTIKKHFPDHWIQAEESGITAGKDTLWIIDPLDGTSNYIHQLPVFCVSIGVMRHDKPVVGVVYDPIHDEMFTAEKGKGTFLNNRRVQASKTDFLSRAFMATGIPFRARDRFDQYLASFEKISLGSVGLRRGGSAALDLAYVACDIAAGALLLEEAGGRITDMWGNPDYFKNGDTLASNGRIHTELLTITSRIFKRVNKDKLCHLN